MVPKIETFEDLVVWKRAHALVLEIYRITCDYPNDEKFSLVSQTEWVRSLSFEGRGLGEGD